MEAAASIVTLGLLLRSCCRELDRLREAFKYAKFELEQLSCKANLFRKMVKKVCKVINEQGEPPDKGLDVEEPEEAVWLERLAEIALKKLQDFLLNFKSDDLDSGFDQFRLQLSWYLRRGTAKDMFQHLSHCESSFTVYLTGNKMKEMSETIKQLRKEIELSRAQGVEPSSTMVLMDSLLAKHEKSYERHRRDCNAEIRKLRKITKSLQEPPRDGESTSTQRRVEADALIAFTSKVVAPVIEKNQGALHSLTPKDRSVASGGRRGHRRRRCHSHTDDKGNRSPSGRGSDSQSEQFDESSRGQLSERSSRTHSNETSSLSSASLAQRSQNSERVSLYSSKPPSLIHESSRSSRAESLDSETRRRHMNRQTAENSFKAPRNAAPTVIDEESNEIDLSNRNARYLSGNVAIQRVIDRREEEINAWVAMHTEGEGNAHRERGSENERLSEDEGGDGPEEKIGSRLVELILNEDSPEEEAYDKKEEEEALSSQIPKEVLREDSPEKASLVETPSEENRLIDEMVEALSKAAKIVAQDEALEEELHDRGISEMKRDKCREHEARCAKGDEFIPQADRNDHKECSSESDGLSRVSSRSHDQHEGFEDAEKRRDLERKDQEYWDKMYRESKMSRKDLARMRRKEEKEAGERRVEGSTDGGKKQRRKRRRLESGVDIGVDFRNDSSRSGRSGEKR